ncbi:MAG: hypothetical protein ACPG77_18900, partial [Nannocystaceae bacterium]
CSPALRRGSRRTLSVTPEQYVYVRTEGEREVLVAVSRAGVPVRIDIENKGLQAQAYVDFTGGSDPVVLADGGEVQVPAFGVRVLVPAGDPCLGRLDGSARARFPVNE